VDTIEIIIGLVLSILAGIFAGFSTIYVFNRIPAKWLCDYGQEPDKEMWGVRIKQRPWTVIFTLVFIVSSIKLMDQGAVYSIVGMLALWLLLQIGIADKMYMIIPDQYVIALAITALGFIPFQVTYLSPLFGVLIGGGSILIIGLLGQLLFKKEAMGFGDVKLFAAIGLMSGTKGIIIILFMTFIISAIIYGIGLVARIIKSGDALPLGPFIAGSTAAYIIFNYEITTLVNIYLDLF